MDLGSPEEVMLGKLLIEKGLLTKDRLAKALSLQAESSTPKPLTRILEEHKLARIEDVLSAVAEIRAKTRVSEDETKGKEEDRLLADLAVKMGFAAGKDVATAARYRDKLAMHGISRRLGEILLEKSVLNQEQFKTLLAELRIKVLDSIQECPNCGKKYDVSGLEAGKLFRCRSCLSVIPIGKKPETDPEPRKQPPAEAALAPAEEKEVPESGETRVPGPAQEGKPPSGKTSRRELPDKLLELRKKIVSATTMRKSKTTSSFASGVCPACGKKFVIAKFDPASPPRCGTCNTRLPVAMAQAPAQEAAAPERRAEPESKPADERTVEREVRPPAPEPAPHAEAAPGAGEAEAAPRRDVAEAPATPQSAHMTQIRAALSAAAEPAPIIAHAPEPAFKPPAAAPADFDADSGPAVEAVPPSRDVPAQLAAETHREPDARIETAIASPAPPGTGKEKEAPQAGKEPAEGETGRFTCPDCGHAYDRQSLAHRKLLSCRGCEALLLVSADGLRKYKGDIGELAPKAPQPSGRETARGVDDVAKRRGKTGSVREKPKTAALKAPAAPPAAEARPAGAAEKPKASDRSAAGGERQSGRRLMHGIEGTCANCSRWFRIPNYTPGMIVRCMSCRAVLEIEDERPPALINDAIFSQKTVMLDLATGKEGEGGEGEKLPPPDEGSGALPPPGEEQAKEFGPYPILEEIARGGMGIVYLAWDQKLERRIALKVMAAGEGATSSQAQRFKREITTTARIRHKNIVTVYDVGVHEGRQYFTMEFIEGPSLLEAIGKVPMKRAVDIVIDVADALDYAHQAGVLHRDLKPANILLEGGKTPKVVDFGLAKDTTDDALSTRTGTAIGTPAYMSPEAVQGRIREITKRSDIFSLGVIFYELITGKQPFRGQNRMEIMMKVVEEEPVPPRLLNPKIPPELEAVCLKAMAKRKRDRYQAAAELADDLRKFRDGKPVTAKPLSMAARIQTSISRKSKIITAGALLAVSMVSFCLGFAAPVVPDVESDPEVRKATKAWRTAVEAEAAPVREDAGQGSPEPRKTQPGSGTPEPNPAKSIEEEFWAKILKAVEMERSVAGKTNFLKSYLDAYPVGKFTTEARSRIAKLESMPQTGKGGQIEDLRRRYIEALEGESIKLPAGVKEGGEKGEYVNAKDGSRLIFVPRGLYTNGSQQGRSSERPMRTVRLSAFFISQCEITNAQFAAFLNETGSDRTTEGEAMVFDSETALGGDRNWGVVKREGGFEPAPGCGSKPAVYVTWYGARSYAAWAGGDLPSEAQWEAACRGGSTGEYFWGESDAWEYMWYRDNSRLMIGEVGKKKPNAFGIHDASGNAVEWCLDYFTEDFYRKPEASAADPVNTKYRGSAILRAVRGGSFDVPEYDCASFRRKGMNPTEGDSATGFRIVLRP